MEDLLDLYAEPYDPVRPVVCFDESPKQLIGEVREPIPPQSGAPARQDTEYKRNGVRNLMMICEPKRGWRDVLIMQRRTKIDFAHAMRHIVGVFRMPGDFVWFPTRWLPGGRLPPLPFPVPLAGCPLLLRARAWRLLSGQCLSVSFGVGVLLFLHPVSFFQIARPLPSSLSACVSLCWLTGCTIASLVSNLPGQRSRSRSVLISRNGTAHAFP